MQNVHETSSFDNDQTPAHGSLEHQVYRFRKQADIVVTNTPPSKSKINLEECKGDSSNREHDWYSLAMIEQVLRTSVK
jgi:hypothetical protein